MMEGNPRESNMTKVIGGKTITSKRGCGQRLNMLKTLQRK